MSIKSSRTVIIVAAIAVLSSISCSGLSLDLKDFPQGDVWGFRTLKGVSVPETGSTNDCAEEALAALCAYAGDKTQPADIRKAFTREFKDGTPSVELIIAARKLGHEPVVRAGDMDSLYGCINAGRPAIIMVELNRLAARGAPYAAPKDIYHFFVVSGYSSDGGAVVVEWPGGGRKAVLVRHLLPAWKQAGFFMLSLNPKS